MASHLVWAARTSAPSPTAEAPAGFGPGQAGAVKVAGIAAKVDPGLVDVNVTLAYQHAQAAGTGMVVTSDGEVLTNNHVIAGATSIKVTDIGNGRTYQATVVGYDTKADLAVLSLTGASGLRTVTFADSSKVAVGDTVVGVGNAGGAGGTPAVAVGSVVSLNQTLHATDENGSHPETLTGMIATSAPVQPGDSGGPLVDTSGKVVGMDTAAAASSSQLGAAASGFAIPIDAARAVAGQITAGQASVEVHVGPTAFLGVSVDPRRTAAGAFVVGVSSGTPAAAAGLVAGDVITGFDDHTIGSATALTSAVGASRAGQKATVSFVDAAGTPKQVTVTLATGPPQ